jgi:hypothetical protein
MRLRKDMAVYQEDMSAHFPTFMTTMVEQQNIIAQQQQQIVRFQHLKASVSYESLYNACCFGKVDVWRLLKTMADGGDKIAKNYEMDRYLESPFSFDYVVAKRLVVFSCPGCGRKRLREGMHMHCVVWPFVIFMVQV